VRYRIIAIGPLKKRFYLEGCRHFLQRLQPLADAEIIELKSTRGRRAATIRSLESEALLKHVHHSEAARGHLVALDEHGTPYRSLALARHIDDLESRGIKQLNLLLGGAEGHAPELLAQTHERWRLSDLTLPHQLARLLLLEQLYRVETIRAGHPYHRE